MIFYLQRDKPFDGVLHPRKDKLKPSRLALRERLARIAKALKIVHGSPEFEKFIAPRVRPGAEILDRVDACCWLEAKELLGYPLTTSQEMRLDEKLGRAKRVMKGRFL